MKIVKEAKSRGIDLRLLGGLAIRLRCPSALQENLKRSYVDIDFVGLRKQRKSVQKLFVEMGYTPRTTFNTMNGHRRLIFNDIENERRIDLFMNEFQMCHKFDFTDRILLDELTLPLADLLLTKLQVFEITSREYKDTIALLNDYEIGVTDTPNVINAGHIAKLCGDDWDLYRTITLNLERIETSLPQYITSPDQAKIRSKIDRLRRMVEDEPKSFGWKIRARIGDKVKWYELPEADAEVVDSRPADQRMLDKKEWVS